MTAHQRPAARPASATHRATRAVAALALAAGLAGCAEGAAPVDVDVDWPALSEQVEQLAADARGTVEELRAELGSADVDSDVRDRAESAVTEAEQAVEAARARLAELQSEATPDPQQLDEAERRLTDARAELEAVAGDTQGAVRDGLDSLSAEIDSLLDRLGEASS